MNATRIDSAGELQRAAELLFKNWKLAVPTALASLLVGILGLFTLASVFTTTALGSAIGGHTGGFAGLLAGLPFLALFAVVAGVLTIISQAVVIHAAEDVWESRPVDLGRSFNVGLSKLVPLIGAFVLIFLIMLIPIALSFVVIGFFLILIIAFFLMYVIPAVVLGNAAPVASISESYQIARRNAGPTFIAFIGIVIASVIGALLQGVLHHGAILSLIGSLIVGGYTSAFIALVASRFYTLLRPQTPLPFPPAG